MIRVVLPYHLRTLARAGREVVLQVDGPVTQHSVMDALEAQFESQIPSSAIGEGVMQRLKHIDQVAYVRFASIYKQFRDVAEFVDEVSSLGKPKKT